VGDSEAHKTLENRQARQFVKHHQACRLISFNFTLANSLLHQSGQCLENDANEPFAETPAIILESKRSISLHKNYSCLQSTVLTNAAIRA